MTQVGATSVPVQNGIEPGRWRATTKLVEVESWVPPMIAFKGDAFGNTQLRQQVTEATMILTDLALKEFTIAM